MVGGDGGGGEGEGGREVGRDGRVAAPMAFDGGDVGAAAAAAAVVVVVAAAAAAWSLPCAAGCSKTVGTSGPPAQAV